MCREAGLGSQTEDKQNVVVVLRDQSIKTHKKAIGVRMTVDQRLQEQA